jgi:hypothetical protein
MLIRGVPKAWVRGVGVYGVLMRACTASAQVRHRVTDCLDGDLVLPPASSVQDAQTRQSRATAG